MSELKPSNPHAFPHKAKTMADLSSGAKNFGMSLGDWYAGQALTNPALCTGQASEWELKRWFGADAAGITRPMIVAQQARAYATAMLHLRDEVTGARSNG